ncbi:MAG: hypothetical protein OXF88_24500 [Rhodobacteraceae bacterium]|nr:hypothetical protein [Paracoccaceae bacterium]MCY4141813.1 hypothetical protein [Paracoccaceae bacterium]
MSGQALAETALAGSMPPEKPTFGLAGGMAESCKTRHEFADRANAVTARSRDRIRMRELVVPRDKRWRNW